MSTGSAGSAAAPPRGVWAGSGALRVLRVPGSGRVEFGHPSGAAYLSLPGGWLQLTPIRGAAGPLSLVVAELPAPSPGPGAVVHLHEELLDIAGLRIDVTGVRPARVPRSIRRRLGSTAALAAALGRRPPAPEILQDGLAALVRGDRNDAVTLLAGRGEGLTPAGDDVLAGYAAWSSHDGRPASLTPAAAGRSAPLGLAYLRCAERGELADVALRLLLAIRGGDVRHATRLADDLDRWGASSGTALLWGFAAGHDALVPAPVRTAGAA